jgi:uncharacterized small protein (DUF1192 family)
MAFMLARPVGWPQTKPEETPEETGMEPDEPRKKLPDIVLGEDISALSAHELEQRIARLEAEIARCSEAMAARHATKSAAENFFKK